MRRIRHHRNIWPVLILFCLTVPILGATSDEDVPAIVAHMRKINENLRKLRSQYDQPDKKSENVELVETIRTHVKAAQKLQPLKTPKIPADQKEAFLKAFRAKLDEVLDTLVQLEDAEKKGDFPSARELILKLNELKKEGHNRFRSED